MRKPVKHDATHVEKPVSVFLVERRNEPAYHLITARSIRPAKAVTTWQAGMNRKYRGGNAVQGPDAPVTTTGKHYLVPSVNLIGKIMPCNCDDPIILQFDDGSLDFFWLRDCTITDLPITPPQKVKTGPKGFQEATLKKFVAIHSFLMKQNKAVSHLTIKQAIGSSCSPQLRGLSGSDQWNLMEGKIVSRTKPGKDYLWKLTEFGRAEGLAVIQSLRK